MTAALQPPLADRMQLLDAARLVAAIGVIVSHIMSELYPGDPLWIIGSASVPFYLFVALYFTVRGFKKDPTRSIGRYLLGRLGKLYVPFLLWNLAYDVMHIIKHQNDPLTSPKVMLWAGMYGHLYFLPLLLATTMLVSLLIRPILASASFRIGLTLALVAAACFATWGYQMPPLPKMPTAQQETLWHVYRTIPPACFGVIFAIWLGSRSRRFGVPMKAGLLGLALMMVALAYQVMYAPHPMLRTLSGLGLVLIAFTPFYSPLLVPMATIGRYSYGIYLSHVAFIRIAVAAINHFDLPHSDLLAILIGLFALVCGTVLSMILARSKWTAWIIGCDFENHRKLTKPAPWLPPETVPTQIADLPEHAPR